MQPKTTPIVIGGFAGLLTSEIQNCHSAVSVHYGVQGANRMGNFAGELLNCNITDCSIDPDCLNPDWYLVGMKPYRSSVIDIQQVKKPYSALLTELNVRHWPEGGE